MFFPAARFRQLSNGRTTVGGAGASSGNSATVHRGAKLAGVKQAMPRPDVVASGVGATFGDE